MSLTKEDLQAIGSLIQKEIKQELVPVINRLDSLEENQDIIRNAVLRMELEHLPRITAALDGVVAGIEKNKEQDRRLSVLEGTVETHDHKIAALEYAVKKAK